MNKVTLAAFVGITTLALVFFEGSLPPMLRYVVPPIALCFAACLATVINKNRRYE